MSRITGLSLRAEGADWNGDSDIGNSLAPSAAYETVKTIRAKIMDAYVKRLYDQWPQMLVDENLPFGRTQIGIFDGWEDIFEKLLACIQKRVTDQVTNPQKDDYPLFSDVKQKFGKVRMYLARWGSVEILDLIEKFEKEAVTTCYSCGAPARLTMVDGLAAPRCGLCEAEDRGSPLN